MELSITSAANPRIKDLLRLRQGKSHLWGDAFLVEGAREITRALRHRFELIELFRSDRENLSPEEEALLRTLPPGATVTMVSARLFGTVVMREATVGVLAVFKVRTRKLSDLDFGNPSLFLALEGIEKPGNLGAILRSADGAGAHGVILIDRKAKPFHHNVVRASTGAIFSVPLAMAEGEDLAHYLKEHKIRPVAASPEATRPYYDLDLRGPVCFVLGTESDGLKKHWRGGDVEAVSVPMRGTCDSLNVSVTAALLLYEALRQRQHGNPS